MWHFLLRSSARHYAPQGTISTGDVVLAKCASPAGIMCSPLRAMVVPRVSAVHGDGK